jgi:hypothetical protein
VTEWRKGAVVEWVGEDELPDGPKRGERGILVTSGSVRRDPNTGDVADWVVDFGFEGPTGVYPKEKLRLIENESPEEEG